MLYKPNPTPSQLKAHQDRINRFHNIGKKAKEDAGIDLKRKDPHATPTEQGPNIETSNVSSVPTPNDHDLAGSFCVLKEAMDFIVASLPVEDRAELLALLLPKYKSGPINLGAAQIAYSSLLVERQASRLRVEDIQEAVATEFGISVPIMLSKRKDQEVVLPRQVAMHLSKLWTKRSLSYIGRKFDGMDHTTVFHASNRIRWLLGERGFNKYLKYPEMPPDTVLAAKIENVRAVLYEKYPTVEALKPPQ